MRLVYEATGVEVKVGDSAVDKDGVRYLVEYFRKPHSPNSSGKITLKDESGNQHEYYVGVIGAKWIDREDRIGWDD